VGVAVDHERRVARPSTAQIGYALDRAQQAAQQSGVQYNLFVGSAQARSVAAAAPPIVVPQPKVPARLLRGRAEILRKSDRLLGPAPPDEDTRQRVTVFYGMGGVGKTTLALEIARRALAKRIAVWWIPADQADTMRAAFYSLAFHLGAREDDFDHMHPADVLWRRLNAIRHPWLLVVDNVDDPTILSGPQHSVQAGTGWLRPPVARHHRIIVSSRNGRPERWASWMDLQHVPPLSAEAGAQVLLDHAPHAGSAAEAASLAEALGGVPLALELAGRYLSSVVSDPFPGGRALRSFAAYQRHFTRREGSLAMSFPGPDDSPQNRRSFMTTWETSLDLLEQQGHDLARPLLRLFSCCGASPLPYRAVVRPEILRDSRPFRGPTPERIGAALRALDGLGLISLHISRPPEGTDADEWAYRLEMHPLVRTVTQANLRSEGMLPEYLLILARSLDALTTSMNPEDAAEWPHYSTLAPHCLAPLELVSQLPGDRREYVRALLTAAGRAAWYRYMAGQYVQSRADHRLLYDIARQVLGDTDRTTLMFGNRYARAIRENGDNAVAQELLRSILDAAVNFLGSEDPVTLTTRLNLGRTLREAGEIATAERELSDLLPIATRVLGERHEDTIVTALNLAVCLRRQNRFEEAERLYRKTLHDWSAEHSAADLTTLDIRYELAETMRQQENYAGAEAELRDVLAIASEVYGPAHPNTLIIRHGLATVLKASGRLDDANAEFREVLRLKRERFGADHPLSKATEAELEP